MAGYLQNLGIAGLLTFGPIVIDAGPKGTTTKFTVSCPQLGPLIAYYNYIVRFGATVTFMGCDVGSDGVTSAEVKNLAVSLPGLVNNLGIVLSELFFDSWELLTNESTNSIFSNPLIVGQTGWMNDNDKGILSYVSTQNATAETALTNLNAGVADGSIQAPITGGAGGQFQQISDSRSLQIFRELLKGQSEYESPAYVLRHTSYQSPGGLYNTSTSGTQLIYSPGQLLTEVGSGWTYPLPGRLYSQIASIPFQFAPSDEAAFYTWGWLKTISRETTLANFMIERDTEYSLALWSNLRYGLR